MSLLFPPPEPHHTAYKVQLAFFNFSFLHFRPPEMSFLYNDGSMKKNGSGPNLQSYLTSSFSSVGGGVELPVHKTVKSNLSHLPDFDESLTRVEILCPLHSEDPMASVQRVSTTCVRLYHRSLFLLCISFVP
jgi:hypothetical protein